MKKQLFFLILFTSLAAYSQPVAVSRTYPLFNGILTMTYHLRNSVRYGTTPYTFMQHGPVTNGVLMLQHDGTFTFTTTAFPASFSYQVIDAQGLISTPATMQFVAHAIGTMRSIMRDNQQQGG
jgi:hypothetical protein